MKNLAVTQQETQWGVPMKVYEIFFNKKAWSGRMWYLKSWICADTKDREKAVWGGNNTESTLSQIFGGINKAMLLNWTLLDFPRWSAHLLVSHSTSILRQRWAHLFWDPRKWNKMPPFKFSYNLCTCHPPSWWVILFAWKNTQQSPPNFTVSSESLAGAKIAAQWKAITCVWKKRKNSSAINSFLSRAPNQIW